MSVQLKPHLQQFVDEQVRTGRYNSAEEVVEAGLNALKLQPTDFAPGELTHLLNQGISDFQAGQIHDGDSVFREIEHLSKSRREDLSR